MDRESAQLKLSRGVTCSTQLAMREGEQVRLDHEALSEGDLGMSCPDLPNLTRGTVLVLPLKLNPRPSTDSRRLIADQGIKNTSNSQIKWYTAQTELLCSFFVCTMSQ